MVQPRSAIPARLSWRARLRDGSQQIVHVDALARASVGDITLAQLLHVAERIGLRLVRERRLRGLGELIDLNESALKPHERRPSGADVRP